VKAARVVHALDGAGHRRPGLLIAYRDEQPVGAAARIAGSDDRWMVYDSTSGGYVVIDSEDAARMFLAGLPLTGRPDRSNGRGYEREDPEVGGPLPPGVDGFAVGGAR
jgi:hypothetical protein